MASTPLSVSLLPLCSKFQLNPLIKLYQIYAKFFIYSKSKIYIPSTLKIYQFFKFDIYSHYQKFKTTLNFKTKLTKLNSKLHKSWFILNNFLFSHKIHIVIALMLYPPNLQYFETKVSILWIPLRFLTLLAGAVAYCAQDCCRILGRFLSPTLL